MHDTKLLFSSVIFCIKKTKFSSCKEKKNVWSHCKKQQRRILTYSNLNFTPDNKNVISRGLRLTPYHKSFSNTRY